jgi:hypothetical protein
MVDANMQLVLINNERHDYNSKMTVVKGLKDVAESVPSKSIEKKKRKKNSFKNWCMPAQPSGYIKGSKHDFL